MTKVRLDQLLVDRELVPTRSKGQALIMAAEVLVNDELVTKVATLVDPAVAIRIRSRSSRFVGRGGEKLFAALQHYQLNVEGVVALDVGSSTGGFTDCLLQSGASHVYALDVGTNQLAYKLRKDARVSVMEKQHIKEATRDMFQTLPRFVVIDVSFIGLRQILTSVVSLLDPPFELLMLVKPQFELGKEYVSSGGVVKDPRQQLRAVSLVAEEIEALGLHVHKEFASPVVGNKKGNQEYFLYAEG